MTWPFVNFLSITGSATAVLGNSPAADPTDSWSEGPFIIASDDSSVRGLYRILLLRRQGYGERMAKHGRNQPGPPPTPAALLREVVRLRGSEQRLQEQNDRLRDNQLLLEEARDDYAELYDCAPHASLTLGESGAVRSANLAAAELLERERSWLIGRPFHQFFGEAHRRKLADCLDPHGSVRGCQVELVLPGAPPVPVHVSRRFSSRKPGVAHVTLVDLHQALVRDTFIATGSDAMQDARRILLIEDHHETAEAMQEVLERRGYEVLHADCVQAAVQIDLMRVDAIVSDIALPDGKGTDLLRQLKERRQVPAIAVSGLARSSDVESARQAGFDVYLTKPVDFPELLGALGAMLDRSPPSSARA